MNTSNMQWRLVVSMSDMFKYIINSLGMYLPVQVNMYNMLEQYLVQRWNIGIRVQYNVILIFWQNKNN